MSITIFVLWCHFQMMVKYETEKLIILSFTKIAKFYCKMNSLPRLIFKTHTHNINRTIFLFFYCPSFPSSRFLTSLPLPSAVKSLGMIPFHFLTHIHTRTIITFIITWRVSYRILFLQWGQTKPHILGFTDTLNHTE